MIEEVAKIVGSAAVIVAAMAWFVRSIILHLLNKDLQQHQGKLEAQSANELEKLRSKLQILAHERQTAFSSLHEKRAELLGGLYELVNDLYAMSYVFGGTMLFGGMKQADSRAEEAYSKAVDLNRFFSKHRIYFSREVCELLDDFLQTISTALMDFKEIAGIPEERLKLEVEFAKRFPELEQKLTRLKKEIEEEFRSMLGVKHNE